MWRVLILAGVFLLLLSIAAALGHGGYENWASQKVGNCCNDADCRPLEDVQWREGPEGPEVLLGREYCKIKIEHLTRKGHSPDGGLAHICVNPYVDGNPGTINNETPNCRRIRCFMGPVKS